MEKRFQILRSFGVIYKILGGIAGVITIISALGVCLMSVISGAALDEAMRYYGSDPFGGMISGLVGGLILSLGIIIYGGFLAVTLYAIGELVFLLIAMEENTRTTALLLQRQAAQ